MRLIPVLRERRLGCWCIPSLGLSPSQDRAVLSIHKDAEKSVPFDSGQSLVLFMLNAFIQLLIYLEDCKEPLPTGRGGHLTGNE